MDILHWRREVAMKTSLGVQRTDTTKRSGITVHVTLKGSTGPSGKAYIFLFTRLNVHVTHNICMCSYTCIDVHDAVQDVHDAIHEISLLYKGLTCQYTTSHSEGKVTKRRIQLDSRSFEYCCIQAKRHHTACCTQLNSSGSFGKAYILHALKICKQ